jgi:hypothetical protein
MLLIKNMPEQETFVEPTPIERANKQLEIAMEIAFGGVLSHPDDPMDSVFVPNVDFRDGGDIKTRLADLAVKELFRFAAEVEKMQTEEKKKALTTYSDEFLALEKPGPFEIAYDYVLGNRTREDSAAIAAGILSEIVATVYKRNLDFREMKEKHFSKTYPTRVDELEHGILVKGQQNQMKGALEFIYKKYKLRPATIDDTDKVKDVVKSRIWLAVQP